MGVRENCPALLANGSDTMTSRTGRAGNAESAQPLFRLYSSISDLQDKKKLWEGDEVAEVSAR